MLEITDVIGGTLLYVLPGQALGCRGPETRARTRKQVKTKNRC